MMNTEQFNENDIEILENGISVKDTFFSKKEIADTFNELKLVKNFIKTQTGQIIFCISDFNRIFIK